MCGIFGLITNEKSGLTPASFKSTVTALFALSESRGKEASGLAISSRDEIAVYKKPWPASRLIKSREFQKFFDGAIAEQNKLLCPLTAIGHARLVTNGLMEINNNNQPVIKAGLVGIHNGIIVNDQALWKKFTALNQQSQVDTEVLLGLIRLFLNQKKSLIAAVQEAFGLIEGTASIAVLFNDRPYLLLATNNGSLYLGQSSNSANLIFASERYILKQLTADHVLKNLFIDPKISQLKPQTGCLIDINDLTLEKFPLTFIQENRNGEQRDAPTMSKVIRDYSTVSPDRSGANDQPPSLVAPVRLDFTKIPPVDFSPIESLKRCCRCILPSTMPFIEFDDRGVCNYCRGYQPIQTKGLELLQKDILLFKNKMGEPDCLLPFSGGRDSSYALHYVKNILKMNPVAYSYDWGMLTDLGRRNQARMCGALGIEHILISADIRTKRNYIRKNVLAWLKKPDLGTIPLFMAGDKQYFYYANKLRKQMGIDLIIYSENPLEKTDFKSGFCHVPPKFNIEHVYNLGISNKFKLSLYYAGQFLKNPAYLNRSLVDSAGAFVSSYFIPHQYLYLYRYIRWDEQEINQTLINQYNWETAADTKSTWRIGDGTASFYNYIYYSVAGFTENDTFRSNQIRENIITRREALDLIKSDNQPRYESIKWYCDTIGLDFEKTLKIINDIPRLYPQ